MSMKDTILHPITGKILRRDVRPMEYNYKEQKIVVEQPGWYSEDNDEDAILSQDDMAAGDYALLIMKERHKRYLAKQNQEISNVALA